MHSRIGRRARVRMVVAMAAAIMMALSGCAGFGGRGGGGTQVVVAMVANPQMQDLEKVSAEFTRAHPDISLKFITLPENELRDRVTQDIATDAGQYDVVTIGTYEVPIWAENEWLTRIDDKVAQTPGYDLADVIKPVREALTFDGGMYAVPFYGESSFLMDRKDLFAKA